MFAANPSECTLLNPFRIIRIYLIDSLHVSMVSKRLKHMKTGLLHFHLLKLNSVFARSFLEMPFAASIS